MKALVIYDSQYGNTKIIAETIAAELENASLEQVNSINASSLDGIDLLVVGSPIHGWRPSEKMIAFISGLKSNQLKGIKAAAFDTRAKFFLHGDAAGKIAKSLEEAGAEIAAKPEGFFVKGTEGPLLPGEQERAKDWAKAIKTRFNT